MVRATKTSKGAAGSLGLDRSSQIVSWMRYFSPLFAPGAIFQSNCYTKSPKFSFVKRSSVMRGSALALMACPSMVQASPGGFFFEGSTQPLNDLPSKSSFQPADFSEVVSWLGWADRAAAHIKSAKRGDFVDILSKL